MLPQLAAHMNGPNGIPYALYGDNAYPLSPYLQKAYQGAALTQAQQRFSTKMSKARVAVEWSFGDISNQWGYLAIKKQQKVLLQPVAMYYRVTALLTNLQTSAYCSSWSALAASLPVDLALPPLCHYALGLFSLASQTLQPCHLLLFLSAMNPAPVFSALLGSLLFSFKFSASPSPYLGVAPQCLAPPPIFSPYNS